MPCRLSDTLSSHPGLPHSLAHQCTAGRIHVLNPMTSTPHFHWLPLPAETVVRESATSHLNNGPRPSPLCGSQNDGHGCGCNAHSLEALLGQHLAPHLPLSAVVEVATNVVIVFVDDEGSCNPSLVLTTSKQVVTPVQQQPSAATVSSHCKNKPATIRHPPNNKN